MKQGRLRLTIANLFKIISKTLGHIEIEKERKKTEKKIKKNKEGNGKLIEVKSMGSEIN